MKHNIPCALSFSDVKSTGTFLLFFSVVLLLFLIIPPVLNHLHLLFLGWFCLPDISLLCLSFAGIETFLDLNFFVGRCTPFRYSSWNCTCRMLVLLDQSEQTIRGVDTFLQLLQRIFIFTDFNVIDPSEQFRLKGSFRPLYGTFPILAPSSVSLSLMSSRIFSLGTPCWNFAASSCLFPFGSHVCWMSLVWPEWV